MALQSTEDGEVRWDCISRSAFKCSQLATPDLTDGSRHELIESAFETGIYKQYCRRIQGESGKSD